MICNRCHQDKPLTDFYRNTKSKRGYHTICKTCYASFYHLDRRAKPRLPYVPPTTLCCIDCSLEKPLAEFKPEPRCKAGHTQPCKVCLAARVRKKRIVDHDHILTLQRQRSQRNRSKINQQMVAWRARNGNRARIAALAHAQRAANPEPFRERDRQRAPQRRIYARMRRAARNPKLLDTQRRGFHLRKARQKGLPSTFTREEKQFMLQYWGYACVVCGRQEGLVGLMLSDDHWIPLASPACPGTVAENMVPLCNGIEGCNTRKKAKDAAVWLRETIGKRKATGILKKVEAYFAIVRQRSSAPTILPETG